MARARTELVHCDVCGEDYAATYRRCPFCSGKGRQDDYDEDFYDEEDTQRAGGKRLSGSSRFDQLDPAKIAIYVLAALIVLAVICVLITLFFRGGTGEVDPAQDTAQTTADVENSAGATPDASSGSDVQVTATAPATPDDNYDPLSQENAPPVESDPVSSALQGGQTTTTSTTAKLTYAGSAKDDITFTAQYPDPITLKVQGGTAQSWSAKNTAVATVSSNGTITPVGNGTTTVDCTLTDGAVLHCTVRVSGFAGQASAQPSSGQTSSGQTSSTAKLTYGGVAKDDITFTAQYPDPITLKVQGGTAASWSVNNPAVATVSSNGTITPVGNGTTTVSCTLEGGTVLKCTVRVSGK